MKNLKELKGVKLLSKNEQKGITGGFGNCPSGYIWSFTALACCRIDTGYCLSTP
jgi:hypothetical protein